LKKWQPFTIHLHGFKKSWDDYLFLLIQKGNANITRIHNEIYTGRLAGYRREDIPFIPHLTLGVFDKDSNQYNHALKEARQLGLDYHCLFDKLNLVKVNPQESTIVECKEFSFSK
jgi:2'-5' RNA ligase